jgi:sigma-54 dependent transcriptional regulator, acetoin dehydrogenase operon transcriptional activator AcoR
MEGLIRIAIPELEDLSRVLRESGYCVNLADMKGTMRFQAATTKGLFAT